MENDEILNLEIKKIIIRYFLETLNVSKEIQNLRNR